MLMGSWYNVFTHSASFKLHKPRDQKQNFLKFPYEQYGRVVTFKQCIGPGGATLEVNLCFRGKYRLHGFKAEVFVLSNRISTLCTNSYLASNFDIKIMSKNIPTDKLLAKSQTTKKPLQIPDKTVSLTPIIGNLSAKKDIRVLQSFST